MHGDFTRDTFDRQKPFSRVMMQQGRVQLDADWNEQTALTLSYVRTLARDILGKGAGPAGDCGFRILTEADLAPAPANAPDPFPPDVREALKKNASALRKGDLMLLPGRYYVEGIAVELRAIILYSAQAGYPFDEATRFEALNDEGASWLAYLDVWEDYVSAEQDEAIAEPALGGVDTCGRALIRWQVRILPGPGTFDEGLEALEAFEARAPGRLSAWTDPGEPEETPCIIAPDARYRGLENQLYRVEIHRGSDSSGEGATFKWSRDNGSSIFPLRRIVEQRAELGHLGRDERSGLSRGDWVELVDDSLTGHDEGGPLARVVEVDRDARALDLDWAGTVTALPLEEVLGKGLKPVLRRWNHQGNAEGDGAVPVEPGAPVELEDGLFIRFSADGAYRSGDYWLIPARVASSDIIWPGGKKDPHELPPRGPVHGYAPLAYFKDGDLKDLRCLFKPTCKKIGEEAAAPPAPAPRAERPAPETEPRPERPAPAPAPRPGRPARPADQ